MYTILPAVVSEKGHSQLAAVLPLSDKIKGATPLRRDLGSDAFLLEVSPPGSPAGAGKALVLAFRGTEPMELVDFQADFDLFPQTGGDR